MLKKLLLIVTLLLVVPTLATAGRGVANSASCIHCHTGAIPVGGEGALACGGCHAKPTTTGAHLLHTDGAGASYGSDANSSVSTYNFNCGNCHPINPAMHGNRTADVELSNAAATGFKQNNPASAGRTGTGTGTVCNNIYCHSAGQYGGVNTYAATPSWGGTFSGNRCAGCHSYPPAYANNAPKANSHIPHNFSCTTCHAGTTADGTTIADASRHVNRSYDVTPGAGVSFTYTYAATGGTCSTISCHANTDATWGGTAVCDACHGNPPPAAAVNYGRDEAASPHLKHAGKGTNYSYACSECHKGNTHGNGTFQDVFIDKSGILAGPDAAYDRTFRTCATVYCHSSGAPFDRPNDYKAPGWSGPLPADCTGCHGGNALSSAPIATGKHGQHINQAAVLGVGYGCGKCHGATVGTASDRLVTGQASHVDGGKTVVFSGGGIYVGTTRSCAATECHQAGKAAAPQPQTPAWNGPAMECNGCHGTGNTLGAPDYENGGAGAVLANSHGKHAQEASDCDKCHTGTTTSGTAINAGAVLHINKNIDVTFNTAKAGSTATWAAGSKTCSNIQCHGAGTPVWGATMPADCTGCHGNDLASATPIVSGKHRAHLDNYTTLGAGNSYSCVACHASTVSGNRTIGNQANHGNGFKNYSGEEAGKIAVAGSGTCSTNYCHSTGQQQDAAIFWNMTAANWYSGRTLDCTGCHGNAGTADFAPVAGAPNYANGGVGSTTANSHSRHVPGAGIIDSTGCAKCHYRTADAAVAGRLRSYSTSHINRVRDVDFAASAGISGVQGRYSSTTQQCMNTYCHGAAPSPKWGASSLACTSCHAAESSAFAANNAGAHKLHYQVATPPSAGTYASMPAGQGAAATAASYQFNCTSCHTTPATHANGEAVPGVAAGQVHIGYSTAGWKGTYNIGATQGSDNGFKWTNGTCSATYCHSNGNGGAGNNTGFTWATPQGTLGCIGCHGGNAGNNPISTGKHPAHINNALVIGTNFGCADCHARTVDGDTHISNKLNHVNKTKDYAGVRAGDSYSSATGVCSAAYCHTDGKGTAKAVTWKDSTTLDCRGCHGSDAAADFASSPAGEPNYVNGGEGTLRANSHKNHTAAGVSACDACHSGTTTSGTAINAGSTLHANGTINVTFNPAKAGAAVTWTAATKTCANISCHGNTSATWGGSAACLVCHSVPQNNRAAITSQFSANSHHIQGTVDNSHCYQCHWEANSDGSINNAYHHMNTPGAPVELVVYGAGSRPATYATSDFMGGISNSGGGAWTKSAPVVINNSSNPSAVTNYQVKITVPYVSGMKNDFSDLRFADGLTELPYWIESYTASSSAIWVKVLSIPASSSKNITMYYGNASATSSSSISATLIPNAVTAMEGSCTDTTNCGYMDNHAEANAVRAYPADIGTRNVSSIYWGSVLDGTSPGSSAREMFYSRFRFLFIPDVSGSWSFAVDSDDASELILNPNDRTIPSGESVIASWYGGHGWLNGQTYAGALSVTANQLYWLDYLQTEWTGGEAAVVWVKRPGETTWKNLNAQNFANMIFSRKYTSPEPTFSIGAEQSVNISNNSFTAIKYTANNSRGEIQKLNYHCLGCHSDQNNGTQPFGDGKTPKQYAWDGSSVAARYAQNGTTPWGKYDASTKSAQTKAFSAHGNAVQNQGGWDTSETWPDTRGASSNVACYDCHNSHGSGVSGTTTSYASATVNAGILKDTTAGKGGYSQTYKPLSGGSADTKNAFTAGAGLCFDCHQNATTGTKPWGYSDTFGATQKIIGYWDTDFFGPGTFGSQTRYPFKAATGHQGGHFGASTTLSDSPSHAIGGLCTPCHDPHGVSPTLGADKQYAVPLLKGTWVTSPYREDTAPASNAAGTAIFEGVPYHIDQNTFASGGVTQTDSQFAGLCLNCHSKPSLTNGTNHAWKSKDRIHEAVKGWKTANGTIQHNFTCSKCHAPHNSRLPRLMVTNCLNKMHKGRAGYNPSPVLSGSGSGDSSSCYSDVGACNDFGYWDLYGGGGSGSFPGNFSGSAVGSNSISCHEGNSPDESWNSVTPWANVQPPPSPTLTAQSSPIYATGATASITFQWSAVTCPTGNPTQYQVEVSTVSNFASLGYQSSWQTTTNWPQVLPAGTWYWRVKARDSVNTNSSSTSLTGSFTIINQTLSPPVLVPQPTSYVIGSGSTASVTFGWSAVNAPDGDAVQYQVDVSSSSSFTTIAYSSTWQAGTSWTQTLPIGTWYWRAKARDSVHTTAASTSTANSFAVTDRTPAVPVPVHQANVTNSLSSSITFGWSTVTAPDGDAVQYLVEVSSASNFGSIAYSSGWQSGASWTQTIPKGTWYWRVTARDSVHTSAASAASASDSFTIVPPAPASPTPTPQPPSYVIGSGSQASVTFQWGAVTAPDGDAPQYLVEVSSAANFATIAYQSGWQAGTNWTQTLAIGTWYWRVTARDSVHVLAVSSPSAGSSFAVSDRTPGASTLTAQPISYVIGSGATSSITFQWSAVTAPDGDAIQYQVDVSSSASFATTPYQSTWQAGTNWTQALPVGTWYWRVKARDSVHTTAASTSTSSSFGVVDRTPAVPTLVHNAGATTNGASITFQWNSVASPDGDAVQYWVDVSLASDFSTINYSTPAWQTATSWTQVLPVGTYYWRVKARDSIHTTAVSSYSASDSFGIIVSSAQSWTTPGTYSYIVPAGVTSITATVKGGGGGGGLNDSEGNQAPGTNGNLVTTVIPVTPGSTLTIYVSSGGYVDANYTDGGAGGSGYHAGSPGSNGEGDGGEYAYGGSGGGGSSAITLAAVRLAEAQGGAGGRSSDYYSYDYDWYYYAGEGGAGGGSDYPATTTAGGGGSGGYEANGGNGSVSITWYE